VTAEGGPAGGPVRARAVFAVLGLGEAGTEIARDLLAGGAAVRGFDPRPDRPPPAGATRCRDESDAARGADVVLSANSAHDAVVALRNGIGGLAAEALWADLNTASPRRKQELADMAEESGRVFCDVAMMSPVPGRGVRTPMLVSGPGAERFARVMRPFGTPVEVIAGPPGAAAERKLLRSVFFKGMAAAITEALAAARAAGLEEWMRDHLRAELDATDATAVDRMERGSVLHARRRADEMAAAAELLDDLGVPALVCRSSEQWLRRLYAEGSRPDPRSP
jgi:3-hydroxyisobutyrate dehydrogenase-like beta-hydroxyacid dehydrogenase